MVSAVGGVPPDRPRTNVDPRATGRAGGMIGRTLLFEGLRWMASTQALGMVAAHLLWIMMLSLALAEGSIDAGFLDAIGRGAFDLYIKLGGAKETSRGAYSGGLDGLVVVWGKVSIPFYLVKRAIDTLRGDRPRWRTWRKAALSTAIAIVGASIALVLLPSAPGAESDWVGWGFGYAGLVFVTSLWAFGFASLVEKIIAKA